MERRDRTKSARRIIGLLLAAAGLTLSVILSAGSLDSGRGIGCGPAGCGAVLSSTWAKVAGVPVSVLAIAVYAAAGAGLVRSWRLDGRRRALLAASAGLLLAAAAWFTFVQIAIIEGWCAWCLATHGVGVVLGAILLAEAKQRRLYALLGPPLVAALAIVQVIWPTTATPSIRPAVEPPAAAHADLILLPDGEALATAEAPHMGDPAAPHRVAVLLDYTCPHCRRHHAALSAYQARQPGSLRVALLPMPLNSTCNRHWPADRDLERFADACGLARLSLVVWRADPQAWPTLDAWLWEGDTPPTAAAARDEVERLLGSARLAEAEARWGDWAQQQIDRNVAAWASLDQPALPVTFARTVEPVYGALDDTAAVAELVAVLATPSP